MKSKLTGSPMQDGPSQKDINTAKEIVGKWVYEEESWWRPIADALSKKEETTAWQCYLKTIAVGCGETDIQRLLKVSSI